MCVYAYVRVEPPTASESDTKSTRRRRMREIYFHVCGEVRREAARVSGRKSRDGMCVIYFSRVFS